MSKKFLTDIDLNKNELQNAVVQCLSTAPSTGVLGQIYYNTTDHLLYQHNGTAWEAVGDNTGAMVTLTENTGSGDTIKSYTLSQGSSTVGIINIPKDYLVKSGSIKTVTTANQPYSGAAEGDKYLDFVVNTKDSAAGSGTTSHISIPVNDLVDAYTAGNGITISAANVVSEKIDISRANGLSSSSGGLGLDLASSGSAGAMSAVDKAKLDALENAPLKYKVSNPALTPSGGVCTWVISSADMGGNAGTETMCRLLDENNAEVVADMQFNVGEIKIYINSTSTIAANKYTALIFA